MESHYDTLGIRKEATAEQIKKAYFQMAKKYHPDAGDETAISKFHEVTEAYKVLSDPVTKKAHDLMLAGEMPKTTELPPSYRSQPEPSTTTTTTSTESPVD